MKKVAVDLSYINSEKKFYESVFVYAKRILTNWSDDKQRQIQLIVHKNVQDIMLKEFPEFNFIIYSENDTIARIPYVRGCYRFFKWKSFINSLDLDVLYLPFCWSGNSGKVNCKKISAILDLRPMRDLVRLGTNSVLFRLLRLSKFYYKCSRYFYTKHIKSADIIITISDYVKNDITNEWKDSHPKIETVYLGIPTSPTRSRPKDIDFDDKYILYVNSLAKYKNVLTLVKAYKEVLKSNNFSDFKLVIVGRETEYWKNEVLPFINNAGINENIIHIKYVSDEELAFLYENAAVFVTTSLHEGFGLTPVEAIIHGCPVISSRCESLPEVTKSDFTMYYNPPLDYLSLSVTIEEALSNNSELKSRFKLISTSFKNKYNVINRANEVYSILERY